MLNFEIKKIRLKLWECTFTYFEDANGNEVATMEIRPDTWSCVAATAHRTMYYSSKNYNYITLKDPSLHIRLTVVNQISH